MRLATLSALALGAAAGYLGARTLLERDTLPEQLPPALRERLERAQARLRRAQSDAMEVLVEVERTREASKQQLREDYLQRVGRADAMSGPADSGGASSEPE